MDQNKKHKSPKSTVEENHSLEDKRLARTKYKIIIFNIINIVLFVSLVFILRRLPTTAENVKQLRSEVASSQGESDVGILHSELDRNSEVIQRLKSEFIDDSGFLRLVALLSELQQNGVIRNYNLPVTNPVTDLTKNKGLPVSVEFVGTQEQVNQSLSLFKELPFMIKDVKVVVTKQEESITVQYSGFIYTDEGFNQN